ncbi:hypothetical protein B5C34_05345 [Pacificimonas flava]|uniref:Uncharacterized protein n=2 Tax=Pacificimonas TaxID=1960290 RepID=A0A219B3M1_9SPHN|nr:MULTISPECIES: phage protein Gp27 family protein [Pacificimonas]MBZ6377355.1 DUF3486 family protein [Pacificimonas aurantium]OWV32937.1 hypothetical protein B5C34_05345 [Pacificimonas flava]
MGGKSTIEQLPDQLQGACHAAIRRGATIDEITGLLNGLGADVSRSAVGRYTKNYSELVRQQRDMTAMAQAFGREFGEGDDRTGLMMTQLMQTLMTRSLIPLLSGDGEEEQLDPLEIGRLAKAVKDIAGASKIDTDRIRAIRAEEREAAKKDAADVAEGAARKTGASAETIQQIRREIMGL